MPKPPLWIHTLVKQYVKKLGSPHRLYVEIKKANENESTGCTISRPALEKLNKQSETVGITWDNVIALHIYFRADGVSLQHLPIIESRSIMDVLVASKKLVFMSGAKGRRQEQRNDLSLWDIRSYSEIQNQMSRLGSQATSELIPVLWRSPATMNAIRNEQWHDWIEKDEASIISIGSPLAALSSEVLLARMFGVDPFVAPHFPSTSQLPFYFLWRPDLAQNFKSAFGLTWQDLKGGFPELAKRNKANRSAAVIIDGRAYESPKTGKSWTICGIIAAQRRTASSTWVCVSGLAGPATLGAARDLKEIAKDLPWSSGRPSKVLWIPVKVKVTTHSARVGDGDVREVGKSEFVGKPRIWDWERGCAE